MSQERNMVHWRIIRTILGVGFFGLLICSILEKIFLGDSNNTEFTVLRILLYIFSGVWILGLLILTPIQILYFQRKERQNQVLETVTAKDLAGLADGTYNPDAELPKWISVPVKIIFWGIVSFFILFVLLVLIGLAISSFYPET